MKIEYDIEHDGRGWIISRSLIGRDFISVDYYTGIDAPWGPYCFGSPSNLKHFKFRLQAKKALKAFTEHKSNV